MEKEEIQHLTLQQVNKRLTFVRKEIEEDKRMRIIWGGDYVWADRVKALNARIKRYKSELRLLRIRRKALLVPKMKQEVNDAYKNRRKLLGPKRVWVKST